MQAMYSSGIVIAALTSVYNWWPLLYDVTTIMDDTKYYMNFILFSAINWMIITNLTTKRGR